MKVVGGEAPAKTKALWILDNIQSARPRLYNHIYEIWASSTEQWLVKWKPNTPTSQQEFLQNYVQQYDVKITHIKEVEQ